MNGSILVVDDDLQFGHSLARALVCDGHKVEVLGGSASAVAALEQRAFDLVFTDLVMPEMDGLALLDRAKALRPTCEVVVMTGHPSVETVQRALRVGARDYITKPLAFERDVRPLVDRILGGTVTPPESAPAWFDGVAAADGPMGALLELLPRVARSEAPVLVSGESGSGKELVARAIHRLSPRSSQPFVAVNCAALNQGVLEAELFGAVRGAYTGSTGDRRGIFQVAEGGTLLLDEVAETTLSLQAKLLRVVQEGEFHRVGEPGRAIRSDVRIVAATHRTLEDEVREGRFRLDLLYRLQVLPLTVPPLRDRLAELPLLVNACAHALGHRTPVEIEPEAHEAMMQHDWPGNIRELANAVEHAFVLGDGSRLRFGDLPAAIQTRSEATVWHDSLVPLQAAEVQQIREAMRRTGCNQSHAARLLGITRRALGYRIRKHGLQKEFGSEPHRCQPALPGFVSGP